MKKIFRALFFVTLALCFTVSPGLLAQNEFYQDVDEGDWYNDYVIFLSERGLACGVAEGQFMPEKAMTRAEFVQMLARISEVDLGQYQGVSSFSDVASGSWCAPAIDWAYENGVAYGVSSSTFAPDRPVTREEAATILNRYAGQLEGFELPEIDEAIAFKDAALISPWAAEAVAKLQTASVFCGDQEQNFNPRQELKRGEAAKIFSVYYLFISTYQLDIYLTEHEDEINAEMEAAQKEMEELANDPDAASYFDEAPTDAPIFQNTATPSGFVGGGFQFLDGDILYTNGTYYFGHIGMACGNGILEIVNNGKGPQRISYSTWANRYSDRYTYVLRRIPAYCNGNTNCRAVSISAAWYGKTYFLDGAGKNYKFLLTAPLVMTTRINCSGLAYKCYRDGAGFYYKVKTIDPHTGNVYYVNPSTMITPTEILDHRVYNGFSAIYKF